MPGICGIVDTSRLVGLDNTLARMIAAMRHHDWYRDERVVLSDARLAMGRVGLDWDHSELAEHETEQTLVLLHGEVYGASTTRDGIASTAQVVAGYQKGGVSFFESNHGSFAAAIHDKRQRRLLLVSDRFGSRPLYFTSASGRFAWASSIAALVTGADISDQPNLRGIAQFFTYGQYFGTDTSWEDVHLLPPASVLQCDLETGEFEIDQYYSLADEVVARVCSPDALDQVEERLVAAVDRRTRDPAALGLSLSGGLDARTILGVMNEDRRVTTVCLGMQGSLDHRCARQMAALVGCPHHSHVLGAGFLSHFRRHLEQMVCLTDGQYLSQCIVMPTLPLYRKLGIQVLLRGHAGELMHMHKAYNYSLDDAALNLPDDKALEQWLFRHLQAYMLDGVDRPLFTEPLQSQLGSLARESLQQSLLASARIAPPVQRICHLFVSERLRRETMMSLVKFNSVVEFRLPYLDGDLVPLLLSLPMDGKLDEQIQTRILRQRRPEFLRVINSNTGAPVGASSYYKRFASLRMRVLAKLGVPGYQPYERLGLWLRRELASTVKEILLSDETFERGIFDADGVRAVVANHLENRHNHTFLLMAMMIFELGQRRFRQQRGAATISVADAGTA